MLKRFKFVVNSECCLWYDGKRGSRGDSKFSNRPVTLESNRDVRFKFESNLEDSEVPRFSSFSGRRNMCGSPKWEYPLPESLYV